VRTTVRLEPTDLAAVNRALRSIPEKLRGKVIRKGMREVLNMGKATAKAHALPADKDTRRAVAIKVKAFRRKIIWGAVGVRVGGPYTENRRFGERYPGWRSHLWDGGFRVWQKGIKANGQPAKPGKMRPSTATGRPFSRFNRGWRKGKGRRNLNPAIIGRRFYLTKASVRIRNNARPAIENAVLEALREMNRGR